MATTKTVIEPVSNDAERIIAFEEPYAVEFTAVGVAPFLCHRYSVESVAGKAAAPKGSKAKKEDDIESYVWRDEKGGLCIPCEHFRMSVVTAAKSQQDPRSPRKSAFDLYRAGISIIDELLPLGVKDWDYIDQRRAGLNKGSSITRSRPAMRTGWKVKGRLQVNLPEYISPSALNYMLQLAGRVQGVGDFRPSYGRYQIVRFERI